MTWLRTTLEVHASAAITGAVFGLPLVLWLVGSTAAPAMEVLTDEGPRTAFVMLPPPSAPAEVEPAPAPAEEAEVDAEGSEAAQSEGDVAAAEPEAPTTGSAPNSRIERAAAEVAAGAAAEAGEPVKRKRRRRNCAPDNPNIVPADDGVIAVDRDLVKYYARHLGALDDLGYIVAHKDDAGRSVGMRVGGFKCNNDAVQAGLHNGDVIQAVNGKPVKTLLGALWVYNRMKSQDDIVLTVGRKGRNIDLRFRLV
ncbi:MAG: hypothetical protein ACI8PZ_001238 [Myxococcota bacterium]|jgi:hypothetical protein